MSSTALLTWLRQACAEYSVEPHAIYQRVASEVWPLRAGSEGQLEAELRKRGHIIPLPTEPAALANVVEVSVVKFLLERLRGVSGVQAQAGTDRVYPDIEVWGSWTQRSEIEPPNARKLSHPGH